MPALVIVNPVLEQSALDRIKTELISKKNKIPHRNPGNILVKK